MYVRKVGLVSVWQLLSRTQFGLLKTMEQSRQGRATVGAKSVNCQKWHRIQLSLKRRLRTLVKGCNDSIRRDESNCAYKEDQTLVKGRKTLHALK